MRILIIGAGATGGAFGSLLQEAGRDVTYLVRSRRADELRRDGLRFVSPTADRTLSVTTLTADESAPPFDLVLVTVKASALESAIVDVRRFVGPDTRVVPILNGIAQIDLLGEVFPGQVIGGAAKIVATLDGAVVRQLMDLTTLAIGVPEGGRPSDGLVEALDVPGIRLEVSDDILGALWEKWMFIAAASVITCLFRNTVGAIVEAGGLPSILQAIEETESVANAAGHPVSVRAHEQSLTLLTEPGSAFTTSLYRDLTAGLPTEAEHILGDLAGRARALEVATPLLDLALIQIRADAAARSRTDAR